MTFLDGVHPQWLDALSLVRDQIERIESSLAGKTYNPSPENVLRALKYPLNDVRVAIFGQDPYPTSGHAMGLAFSVPSNISPLPKSLTNIFKELHDDVGCSTPTNGDLTSWSEQGVALINRVLTVPPGVSNGHRNIGWQSVTNEIARVLGERDVVAILWGNNAAELKSFFRNEWVIKSAHPSPLSAYRGFFGSRSFSLANHILRDSTLGEINWCQ